MELHIHFLGDPQQVASITWMVGLSWQSESGKLGKFRQNVTVLDEGLFTLLTIIRTRDWRYNLVTIAPFSDFDVTFSKWQFFDDNMSKC
jgi:hypothetical protein